MTTLDIIAFKKTIEDFINDSELPREVVRMVIKEIYANTERDAYKEAMSELQAKEQKDGIEESNTK